MRQLILMATAVALTLGTASASLADNGRAPDCGKNTVCQQQLPKSQKQSVQIQQHSTSKKVMIKEKVTVHASTGPRIGDNARRGQRFERTTNSRFAAPPRGQEYRVVDGTLVRVDSKTLQIVAVVGLLSALLN